MSIYQPFPIDVEPEDLAEDQIAFLQAALPGWQPHEGNLELLLIRANSQLAAELRTLIADVPPSIFRYFGATIAGVPPNDATSATVDSTWTMIDTAGYTIPAGTLVSVPASGEEAMAFEVLDDVTVAPGSAATAAGAVTLVAIEAGSAGNGLSGSAALLEPLDFVASIALVGTTAGGTDAESDEDYQDRLSRELQLLSPTPILPEDFAILAQRVAGVERTLAIDAADVVVGTINEIQRIGSLIVGGQAVDPPTGGSFTLTFAGQTTAAIAWNATAAAVQSALEALSNIAPGDVACTGGQLPSGFPVDVEFKGAYLGTDVGQMTINNGSITPGGSGYAISTIQQGQTLTAVQERTVVVASVDVAGEAVSNTVKSQVIDLLESMRETNFVVLVVDATYSTIKVTATATALEGYDPAAVETAAEAALADYLDPSNWGQPGFGDKRAWLKKDTVYRGELYAVLNAVEGLDVVTALTLAKGAGALGTADVTIDGQAPLTRPGVIDVTVTAP